MQRTTILYHMGQLDCFPLTSEGQFLKNRYSGVVDKIYFEHLRHFYKMGFLDSYYNSQTLSWKKDFQVLRVPLMAFQCVILKISWHYQYVSGQVG